MKARTILMVAVWSLVVTVGCKKKDDDKLIPFPTDTTGSFTQVERLGRPAVNEGLITENANLNAFNSVPPTADLSATAVLTDATATLTAFGNNGQRIGEIVTAFLPDVMRIDTNQSVPVATTAYSFNAQAVGTNGVVQPVSGRKIEDDVIDITLSVLTNGGITTDNVGYTGFGGNEAQPGHSLLQGQGAPLGAATFPFLADPE